MKILIKGEWVEAGSKADDDGAFKRKESDFRNSISPDGKFKPEKDRYAIYVSYACPWACRTLMMRKLKGLENVENKKIKEFSFGMKQRLGFAQAILNSGSIMLLDEPFVGLDVNGRNMVKEYVKDMVEKKQMAVVFSDHNLDEVKALCNRLVVIRNGKKFMMGI